MKKILFIIKNKNEASSRFRVIAYFNRLENDFDIDVFYSEYHNRNIAKIFRSITKRFRYLTLLLRIKSYDIVYMQRPMSSDHSSSTFFEKLLVSRNPNFIFDFDDALFVHNKHKIIKLISMVKTCICGNRYLHDFSIKYNTSTCIIPTAIDTEVFAPKSCTDNSTITIGWTGTSGNYQFFTDNMISQLSTLLEKHKHVNFLFICDNKPEARFTFPYDFIRWNENSEISDLQRIDIGLMPLKDSSWSRGKCGFKLIQYGAIGIPAIASNTGVNSEVIINNETGLLVENDDWFTPIEALLKSPDIRTEMGKLAVQHISKNYSLDTNYKKFRGAITSLIDT
jgi:glycosyltransferase involved in cell wall biosynthesis